MPPDATQTVVVVLEAQENGERLVWDFGKRQENVISSTVGEVGDWLRIDGPDMSVTQPLLRTSSAPIHGLPGRHVMIEVPVVKLPDFKTDLGIAAGSDRSKRFYSPILGTVDAFVEVDLTENKLFNVQVIKVWPKIQAALKLKTGLQVEWMCREQAVGNQTSESESEFLRLLEQLQLGNREGLVIKTTNNSHVIVSQTKDGDTQLFLTRSADLHVGQVVHFLPIYECFDVAVHFAADSRAVGDGYVLPLRDDTNQFLIASEKVEVVDGRYRATHLGNLMDPEFILSNPSTNDVLLRMELDLKAAQVVFTAIGFAPEAGDDASSIDRGSDDRPISTSPITCDLYWEPCSGLLDLPLEPQECVMSVRCSGSSSVKNVDKTFFDSPASDAKYPHFHTFTADLEKRFGTADLPVRSGWYEVRIRYVAHVCKSNKAPLAVVYALKPIPPPATPAFPAVKSAKQLEDKACDVPAKRKSTSSMTSSTWTSSTLASDMPSLPLDPQHYSMSARCWMNKGDKAFFECPAPNAKYPKFHTLTKDLEQRFGSAGLPVVGSWYEVRLRYNLYAHKAREAPLVCISVLNPMQKPLQPYFNALNSSKQLENNEYVVSAECTEFKGDETLFQCAADGFTRQIFMMKTKLFPRTDAPVVGQWYELTLRFFATKGPGAPSTKVSCAITIPRPNKPYFQKRPTDCLESSTNAPGASSSAGSFASWNHPEQDIQELTAVICGQPNAREFELYSPTGWQPEPCFYTPKFYCGGQIGLVGKWYKLKIRMSYTPRVLSDVFRAEMASPLLPTRVENGVVQLGTSLKPVRAIDNVPCTHSEDLGRVIDCDNVIGRAFNSRTALDCWCTRRKATDAPSVKAAWKVTALARPDESAQTAADPANGSGMRTTTGAQSGTYYKQDLSGVVCYHDDGLYFVFSPQLASEAVLEGPLDGLDIGQWISFNVILNGSNEMLAVTCDVVIPMRADESVRTVSTNFIGRVHDVHGLVRKAAPGIHKAVIRYVYEEGADSGYWQLDYVCS